jgi:dephospho-CoA kinase
VIVLGLTGSIAMGKSTAAATFRSFGLPVFDADAAVHRLLGQGGAGVGPVGEAFPDCAGERSIDRRKLGRRVFGDPAALRQLEAILHPLVRAEQEGFLARCRTRGERVAVLDIPLLYETGAEHRLDAVAVVSAPALLQSQRVRRRPGMTPARLAAIRARQLPDREKRRRADFVIPTGLDRRRAVEAIAAIIDRLRGRSAGFRPARRQRVSGILLAR